MPTIVRFTLVGPPPVDPGNHAKGLRALVLRWLALESQDVAAALHGMNGFKPYAIGPLTACDKRGLWRFDVRLLDDRLAPLLTAGVEKARGLIRLGTDCYTLAGNPSVLCSTGWVDLIGAARARRCWKLRFSTPTAVRAGSGRRTIQALPQAAVFARGWFQRWRSFAPMELPHDTEAAVDVLQVREVQGKTVSCKLDPGRAVEGFVGTALFSLPQQARFAPEVLAAVDALTLLAEFSGTGMETMRGMGVTLREGSALP